MGRSNINLVGNTVTGQNLGEGAGVFKEKNTANNMQFKSISATGTSIQIFNRANDILISGSTGGGGGGTITGGTNGLGVDGMNICLGGILTSDVNINDSYTGNYGVYFDEIKHFCANSYNAGTNRSAIYDMNAITGIAMCAYNSSTTPFPQNAILKLCPTTGEISACTYDNVGLSYSSMSIKKTSITLSLITGGTGSLYLCNLPPKTTETCGIYLDGTGKLSYGIISGGSGSGGTTYIFANGLTETAGTACLGGVLTNDTTVTGSDVDILTLEAIGDYSGAADTIAPYLQFFGDSAITLRIDTDRGGDNYQTGLQVDDFGGSQTVTLNLSNPTGSSHIELSSCAVCGLLLHSTNGIFISGNTYLEKPPAAGTYLDSALTWDTGTTKIRRMPMLQEWVTSESAIQYMGQKYAYPTHSVFMTDIAICSYFPNYIFKQNINLDNIATTLLFTIPSGKKAFLNRAKLIMLKDATPTDFTVSIGNNQGGVSYSNLLAPFSIDDVLINDTYELPICACAIGIDTGNNCCAQVYFYVPTGSTATNNLCAHLLVEGFMY